MARFADRRDAGRRLAAALRHLDGVVVLGLPRGGVPVAFEVAGALGAPLDVLIVRKLGVPYQPELAMGAIGEGGVVVLNEALLRRLRIRGADLAAVQQREQAELDSRARRYRADRAPINITGRTVVVVDDGIATGATARAGCQVARARGAGRVILAAPVIAQGSAESLLDDADEVIAVVTPRYFGSVGQFYRDFYATSDDEVVRLLSLGRHGSGS
jgi:putative phosphoribosyl transferase